MGLNMKSNNDLNKEAAQNLISLIQINNHDPYLENMVVIKLNEYYQDRLISELSHYYAKHPAMVEGTKR